MRKTIKRLLRDESGVTAIEYALIAAATCVGTVTLIASSGTSLTSIWTTVSHGLSTAAGGTG